MRILRFRAWDKTENNMRPDFQDTYMFGDVIGENNEGDEEKYILMQFTERTDTNGNDIYEGDLIDYKGQLCEVKFEKGRWNTVHKEVGLDVELPLNAMSGKDIKIISNIYEYQKEYVEDDNDAD